MDQRSRNKASVSEYIIAPNASDISRISDLSFNLPMRLSFHALHKQNEASKFATTCLNIEYKRGVEYYLQTWNEHNKIGMPAKTSFKAATSCGAQSVMKQLGFQSSLCSNAAALTTRKKSIIISVVSLCCIIQATGNPI
jgi:hypothetical protein